jgi:hypothetical protein
MGRFEPWFEVAAVHVHVGDLIAALRGLIEAASSAKTFSQE